MIKDIRYHHQVHGLLLDSYLNQGWFRIGQFIFTTDYVPGSDSNYRVFWLRYRLSSYTFGRKQQKLLKTNERFSATIRPLQITDELNDLYQNYYDKLNFPASPSLRFNLYEFGGIESVGHNVFDSFLIELRDQEKLIAAGVFDKGINSLAGIINFYHPNYKKFSLGKHLMLLKMEFAIREGLEFYYPGYIALGYNKFDYKLFPGEENAEIYDPISENWFKFDPLLMEALKDNPPPIDFADLQPKL